MAKANRLPQTNIVRIIGGTHRGRKLPFPDINGLRPTTDRVRETVFNWLRPKLPGARCLDLFCGSGALGLEALSHGAEFVAFVDQQKSVCNQIVSNLETLKQTNGAVHFQSADQFLSTCEANCFDIVFLDPPFGKGLLKNYCDRLENSNCLKADATIYLEAEFPLEEINLPNNWLLARNKKAGAVHYGLVSRTPG